MKRIGAALAVYLFPLIAAASPAAESHGGEHGGGIVWVSDVFGNEGKTGLIFILINFGVLLYLLERILFKPLRRRTAEKHDAIKAELDAATKAHAEAKAMVSEYRRRLDGLAEEAKALLAEAREKAEADRQRIIEAAEREAKQIKESAAAAAAREAEALRRQIEAEVVDQAVARAEKIIVESINASDQRRMVDDYVGHLTQVDFSGPDSSGRGAAGGAA